MVRTIASVRSLASARTIAKVRTGYRRSILALSPVAYWRLDEASGTMIADIAGSSRNGTIVGGVTLAQAGALAAEPDASSNTAALFNGTTGRITFPASSVVTPGALSLEAWVYMTSAQDGIFLSRSANGTYLRVFASRIPFAQIILSSGTYAATSSTEIVLNTWNHIVMTWVSGGYLRLFLNTFQVGISTLTVAGTVTPAAAAPEIGSFYGGLFWAGMVDEAVMYGRELTATEVLENYNIGLDQKRGRGAAVRSVAA